MGRQTKQDYGPALEAVEGGMGVKDASRWFQIEYQTLLYHVKRKGITGGYKPRDKRHLAEKIAERLQEHPSGCITWIGKPTTFVAGMQSPQRAYNYLVGVKFNYMKKKKLKTCATASCLNHAHYEGFRKGRDADILAAWQAYQAAKVTLQTLASKYGITRERVRQILKTMGYQNGTHGDFTPEA